MFKKILLLICVIACCATIWCVAANADQNTQPNSVLIQNNVNKSIERIKHCNSIDNVISNDVNVNEIMYQELTLDKTNTLTEQLSKENVVLAFKTLEEKEKQEKKVGKLLYENIEVSEDDEFLLAVIIFCEAGNQSQDGKVAVGNVVLNRVASSKYPNSISEVLYQTAQFTPVSTGWFDRELKKGTVDDTCLQAAKDAIGGTNIVGGRLSFHKTNGLDEGLILGDHVFF